MKASYGTEGNIEGLFALFQFGGRFYLGENTNCQVKITTTAGALCLKKAKIKLSESGNYDPKL